MSLPLQNLLRYWRASLQDSAQHIDAEALSLYDLPPDCAASGNVPLEICDQLWADAEATIPTAVFARLQNIPVLVAPVFLSAAHEHVKAFEDLKGSQAPLWIACQCNKTGNIRLHEKLRPQDALIIDRDVIAPLSSNTPTYTTLDKVQAFLDENTFNADKEGVSWKDIWKHALLLFEKVFQASPETWPNGLMVNQGYMITYGERPTDTAGAIRAVYERLLNEKEKEPLVLMGLLEKGASADVQQDGKCHSASKLKHTAQMGGEYPLNNGQRQALSAVLTASEGSTIAVNGPPGTGKTTLLQSIVGSLWTQAAINGGEPPVILAAATTNQAITNILRSFKNAALPANHRLGASTLSKRWIPKVEEYGLFIPSETQAEAAGKEYQIAYCPSRKTAWAGLPEITENKDYVEKAEASWLAAAQAWEADIKGVHEGTTRLRERLLTLNKAIRVSWELWENLQNFIENKTDASSVRDCIELWKKNDKNLDKHAALLEKQAHQALTIFHTPLSLLAWLPFIRRKIWGRVYAFLSQQKLVDKTWTWETVLSEREFRSWLTRRTKYLQKLKDDIAKKIAAWNQWSQQIDQALPQEDPAALAVSEKALQTVLDLQIRTEMFLLAGRYWEGRWIFEMKDVLDKLPTNPKILTGWNKDNCEARWRRYAKLTPCLVATAYTAPRVFEYYNGDNRSLFGFADLLIVEEAGQVAPHVGGALFSLAQKALVVGDTQQIEPVWGVSPAIDGGNIEHYELSSARPELEAVGMLASEGSIMKMAQAASAYSSAGHKGVFLDEHWRCRRSTIAYCNDLAYGGKLTPLREDGSYDFPPLGYAHIAGQADRRGTSWSNATEAQVIAAWIVKNKDVLAKNTKLSERLAIVTPFKAQISVLQKALKANGLDAEKITTGTVHTLQGAERDIVIFSSVYSSNVARSLFFDRGVNMLNVAVSRAKESFLLFGDMRLFRAEKSTPSGLLARHLFKNPDCEILDVEPTLALRVPQNIGETVERIDTLEGHRQLLRRAIDEARERLLIVSPYLSVHALEADGIPERLKQASQRGVRITVCYDPAMNKMENGQFYPRVQAALDVLAQTAAEVRAITPAHNKTLAVDSAWISEGSFNWLSASRLQDSIYQRHETSILYQGGKVAYFIEQAHASIISSRTHNA